MKPLKVLEEISNIAGKNDKFELLKNNSGDKELASLLDATFNRNRIYHIKKFNENQPRTWDVDRNEMGAKINVSTHRYFTDVVLDKLENRHWTGNSAIENVELFFQACTPEEQKWYARVLRKDLKAGFSDKTAVKAGFKDIPLFDVMLAKDAKLCKKLQEIISGGVWVSPKLDGYRCLAIVNEGEVTLLSRNGTTYHNFPTVEQALKKAFPNGKYVFDGEIMSDDFQSMQKSAFANKRQTTVGDVFYAVFGYIDFNEWKTQKFKMLTKGRMEWLDKLSANFDNKVLTKVDQIYTEDLNQAYTLQTAWEVHGYEGAMVLPNIPYYTGKKTNRLLKFKTMITEDCVIQGMYEGEAGSRLQGLMGGVVVKQENGEICEVGSGWTDEDRKVMWENQELYVGNIIEVKYQELTPDNKMRFPVFLRFRNDKSKT